MNTMEKFEKHIRQKFQEREISPSPKAWEQINEALGEEKRSQNKRPLFWTVGIAAGLLAVVTLSINFWNAKDTQPAENTIVEGTSENEAEKEVVTPLMEIAQEEPNPPTPSEENTIPVVEKEQLEFTSDTGFSGKPKNTSGVVENQQETIGLQSSAIVGAEKVIDTKIQNKLNEVLAQVTAMEESKITVTDAEIDSLLLAAQHELLLDKVMQEDGKVDAMALLNEVEEELDQTFRDQLFDTLKEGFFKLRTAVADRNN